MHGGWTRFFTIVVAVVSASGGCARDAATSTSRPADRAAAGAADVFPIMCWEHRPRADLFGHPRGGLASLAECGFTVAGFVQPEHLPECERLGLRAIVGRPGAAYKWEQMSDEAIDATVRQIVTGAGESPAIIGYFVTDEPGAQKFPAVAKAVAAVRKYAPGKQPYVNLYPDYATIGATDRSQLGADSYTAYLESFIREVKPDLISYDNYRVPTSNDLADADKAASYFQNLLTVRRVSLEHGLPFWHVVAANRIRPYTPAPSPANLLVQAYTTLAAGGRGLTWFTYYVGSYAYAAVDMEGNRTATWSYLKMVNDQVKVIGPTLLTLRSTGVYFTSPAAAAGDLPLLPGKLVASVECATPVMVGEFVGPGGEAWVMLVNLSLREAAKPKLTWVGAGAGEVAEAMSPVDGSMSAIEADNSVRLAAGQGVLIRLP